MRRLTRTGGRVRPADVGLARMFDHDLDVLLVKRRDIDDRAIDMDVAVRQWRTRTGSASWTAPARLAA